MPLLALPAADLASLNASVAELIFLGVAAFQHVVFGQILDAHATEFGV